MLVLLETVPGSSQPALHAGEKTHIERPFSSTKWSSDVFRFHVGPLPGCNLKRQSLESLNVTGEHSESRIGTAEPD